MSEFENYFSENFARVLSLVETIDKKLVNKLMSYISKLPQSMKNNIKNEESCMRDSLDSTIRLQILEDYLNIESVRYNNFLKTSLYLYPFYEGELFFNDENNDFDHSMLICSFTQRNTEDNVLIKFFYEEKNNKYNFKDVLIPKDDKELDYVVYLDKLQDFYVLTSIFFFDGVEMYKNERMFTYDELKEFVINEELDEDDELEDAYDNEADL